VALLTTLGDAAADGAGITMADARDRVAAAIEFGDTVAQLAPAGHAIHGALAEARDVLAFLEEEIPWYSQSGAWLTPATRTYGSMQAAIDAIESAAATVRIDPDAPLPATRFEAPARLPWGWIAGGVAALAAAAIYLRARARRAA
jgi:hypothetical protein